MENSFFFSEMCLSQEVLIIINENNENHKWKIINGNNLSNWCKGKMINISAHFCFRDTVVPKIWAKNSRWHKHDLHQLNKHNFFRLIWE